MDNANSHSTSIQTQRCETCNARKRPGRLTIGYMLQRLREEVFGTERGFFLTMWHLFVKPQQVTSAFIRGDSLRYFSPIKYFIVIFAVSLLMAKSQSLFDAQIVKHLVENKIADNDIATAFVMDWNAALYLPMVLILALATRGFFRQSGLNYAEHLVVATYGWAQTVLVSTLSFLLLGGIKALGYKGGWLLILLLMAPVFWIWFCSAVFQQRNLAGLTRGFVTLPFAYVCFLLLFFAVVASIKLMQSIF